MALAVTSSSTASTAAASSVYWNLHGHAEDVVCAAAQGRVCATGDTDGVVLLWRFAGATPEHVCRMSTGGPAAVHAAWSDAATLLVAQGDGCATVWDVEKGVRTRMVSRYAVRGRCAWPVLNSVAAMARDTFVFGGDDGYLVAADKRSDTPVSSAHLAVPIISIATAGFSLFVGDICGTLRWFDTRTGSREMERIVCGSCGITSIATDGQQDRIVAYSMDGRAQLIDTQPFALSSSDRLLGAAELGANERQMLLRGEWVPGSESVVLPNGAGDVVTISAKDIVGGATRTVHACGGGAAMSTSVCVADDLLVCCGDGGDVAVYQR
ncbi:U5 snRNP-specific 40 kDa protein [Novymonas esmeraldas]|uniref:U5 snRNP-specific 40 kDa protein n=1 Tax=Novymonas esmeraldas TaxID=1808958 RepID=A0AAW0EP39_9TRYP